MPDTRATKQLWRLDNVACAGPGGEPEDDLHGREPEVFSGNVREPEIGPTEILSKTSNNAFAVRWKDFLGRLSRSIRTDCRFKWLEWTQTREETIRLSGTRYRCDLVTVEKWTCLDRN